MGDITDTIDEYEIQQSSEAEIGEYAEFTNESLNSMKRLLKICEPLDRGENVDVVELKRLREDVRNITMPFSMDTLGKCFEGR